MRREESYVLVWWQLAKSPGCMQARLYRMTSATLLCDSVHMYRPRRMRSGRMRWISSAACPRARCTTLSRCPCICDTATWSSLSACPTSGRLEMEMLHLHHVCQLTSFKASKCPKQWGKHNKGGHVPVKDGDVCGLHAVDKLGELRDACGAEGRTPAEDTCEVVACPKRENAEPTLSENVRICDKQQETNTNKSIQLSLFSFPLFSIVCRQDFSSVLLSASLRHTLSLGSPCQSQACPFL